MSLQTDSALDLCTIAWADKEGYVCISTLDRDSSVWKDKMFAWPTEREKVGDLLERARDSGKDTYWCPMVFSRPKRSKKAALPTDMLWADLDEADPRTFPEDLRPTAWWRTSPGRYQALWKFADGQTLEPKLQEVLNKKLTYKVDGDKGGWDITQVLRLPGLPNHKYDNVKVAKAHVNGVAPDPVKMTFLLDDVKISGGGESPETPTAAALPSPEAVLKKKGRKINASAKQLLRARSTSGDRSSTLWKLTCLLAESGLDETQIVSLTKGSVWNKFKGRDNELDRLATEARKAIKHVGTDNHSTDSQRSDDGDLDDTDDEIDDDDTEPYEDIEPVSWREFARDRRPIKWLVADVWGEGEVGFVSGLPKSYKSWVALDLGMSVSSGTRFLGSFQCLRENVIIIQEEDPKPVLQERLDLIAASRGLVGLQPHKDGKSATMWYNPPETLHIISNGGFQVTDEGWMDKLGDWITERDAKLVILDPLSMIASGFDEFKMFDMMNKVFKPIKRLRAETGAAFCVVHHHKKGNSEGFGGAKEMYGSVAGWAWEECALHIDLEAQGKIRAERFSKHKSLAPLTIEMGDIENAGWHPLVYEGSGGGTENIIELLTTFESGATVEDLQKQMGMGRDAITRQLKALVNQGLIEEKLAPRKAGQKGRSKRIWRLVRE